MLDNDVFNSWFDCTQGAKPVPLAITLAIGLGIRFLVPVPEGITVKVQNKQQSSALAE